MPPSFAIGPATPTMVASAHTLDPKATAHDCQAELNDINKRYGADLEFMRIEFERLERDLVPDNVSDLAAVSRHGRLVFFIQHLEQTRDQLRGFDELLRGSSQDSRVPQHDGAFWHGRLEALKAVHKHVIESLMPIKSRLAAQLFQPLNDRQGHQGPRNPGAGGSHTSPHGAAALPPPVNRAPLSSAPATVPQPAHVTSQPPNHPGMSAPAAKRHPPPSAASELDRLGAPQAPHAPTSGQPGCATGVAGRCGCDLSGGGGSSGLCPEHGLPSVSSIPDFACLEALEDRALDDSLSDERLGGHSSLGDASGLGADAFFPSLAESNDPGGDDAGILSEWDLSTVPSSNHHSSNHAGVSGSHKHATKGPGGPLRSGPGRKRSRGPGCGDPSDSGGGGSGGKQLEGDTSGSGDANPKAAKAKSVEYQCSICAESYPGASTLNPWWALTREACPKCGKQQIPRIDISDPANTIEYHPALLKSALVGPGGVGDGCADDAEAGDGDDDQAAGNLRGEANSGDGGGGAGDDLSGPSLMAMADEAGSSTPGGQLSGGAAGPHESLGGHGGVGQDGDGEEHGSASGSGAEDDEEVPLGDEASRLPTAQAAKLLVLIAHARSCPGHHASRQHSEVCKSVKYLMLHIRDCCGKLPGGAECSFPWCKPCKYLIHHLVKCRKPERCPICSPADLPPALHKLKALNMLRESQQPTPSSEAPNSVIG
mmetsp:Transcript_44430/g.100452  ORF Transcript_44430/g.100452 Transcript_44430/m.100452 type:complete len:711 (-) Transcript_44430:440-2572(-)|eukprot:CAMPEP_0172597336 /NCGR_PEP_ID=MMETSP1068-20121228/17306_1 /TAXON_ID=35684 /ORGANISM="Pseudopedinella elastica, Strain CCMP716" /LENGTH=710 /DNA_ID=CAMNT_0013396813 /DNA_START=141 /DNA_END=2273 /DNA_ORIENTATION=-